MSENTIWLSNIEVLKKHHPKIPLLLDGPTPFKMEVHYGCQKIPNLHVLTQENQSIIMYPEDNPLKELPDLLKKLEKIEGKVICIFGFELGLFAGPIAERLGNTNIIIFFEAIPAIFKHALHHVDLTELLNHPNVKLAVGELPRPLDILSGEKERLYSANGFHFLTHENSYALAPKWYDEANRRFKKYLNKKMVQRTTLAASEEKFFINRFKNLLSLMDSFPVDSLNNRFKNIPCIIVAAGPSLSKNIDELKHLENKAVIIAVDAALSPLMQKAITPHLVTSLDNNDFTFEKVRPYLEHFKKMGLLFIPEITPLIPNYVKTSFKFYTFLDGASKKLFERLFNVSSFSSSECQSVIHIAIHAAQIMGCDPIIFTGLDLAFTNSKDHAEGTILHWGNKPSSIPNTIMAEDINGNHVSTSEGFLSILEICEEMIRNSPDRNYIDATEGGLRIKGTQILSLKKSISSFCNQKHSISLSPDKRHTVCIDAKKSYEELKKLKLNIRKSLRKIDTYFNYISRIENFFENQKNIPKEPEALPENILSLIYRIDHLNIQLNGEEIFEYLAGLFAKAMDEYIKLDIKIAKTNASNIPIESFKARLQQQKMVQKMRKEALHFLLNHVNEQCLIFKNLFHLENRVAKKSHSEQSKLNLAEFFFYHDHLIKAQALFEQLPINSPDVAFYLGCIKIKQGNIKEGMELLNFAVQKDSSLQLKKESFIKGMGKAWLKYTGLESYRKIAVKRFLEIDPGHSEALKLIKQMEQKELKTAMDELVDKAKIFISNGHLEEAVSMLSEVLEKSPDQHEPYGLLGEISLMANDFQSAVNFFQKVCELSSDNTSYLLKLGFSLLQLNQFDRGFSIIEQRIGTSKELFQHWIEAGDFLFSAKQYALAAKAYCNYFEKNNDNQIALKMGDSLLLLGDLRKAKQIFNDIKEDDCLIQETQERLQIINRLQKFSLCRF